MLMAKSLPSLLWAEAMSTAAYVMNRAINTGLDQTPIELWTGKKPDVGHMRVFGTNAYAHVNKGQRRKWEPKATPLVFVGYSSTTKNVRLYEAASQSIKEFRDVVFDPNSEMVERTGIVIQCEDDVQEFELDKPGPGSIGQEPEDDQDEFYDSIAGVAKPRGRPKGSTNKVYQKVHRDLRSNILLTAMGVPVTYDEAINVDDSKEWLKAMDEEMVSLDKNRTWTLTSLPSSRRAIANRWLYKVKENADGTVGRFKARLVVKGFSQREGIDYSETWAPVAKKQAVLVALALAAQHDMEVVHFDVKTAFLHGDLDEDIYMVQPIGYDDGSGRVCRLQNALYGLKQAPRAWYAKLRDALLNFGLVRSSAEPCVFVEHKEDSMTILVVYVDDGLLSSTSMAKITELVAFLSVKFEMSVEQPQLMIGLEIIRDRRPGTIKVHQAAYIRRVLDRYGMTDCKPAATPADASSKLRKVTRDSDIVDAPYAEAVGRLMYAMTCTRPDIAYAVGKVAQLKAKPSQVHWTAVKHVMRYLKGTANLGIVFKANQDELFGYCDADYAGDLDNRKSTSGYVFVLATGPVAWQSRLQKIQAMSTCEAEYIATADAAKEALWLRQLLLDLGPRSVGATKLWCDNQGAIKLMANPEVTNHSKHIDVRHHFIRDLVADGHLIVDYVPTDRQAADMLTKALHGPCFERCIGQLGLK